MTTETRIRTINTLWRDRFAELLALIRAAAKYFTQRKL